MANIIRNTVRFVSVAMATIYFTLNVAFAYTPETNFWTERRRNVAPRSPRTDSLFLASLPLPAPVNPLNDSVNTRLTALPDTIAQRLPPTFTSQHAPLFGALLPAFGSIRKVWVPPTGPGKRIVVHVQDVHQNEAAQLHISNVVNSLLEVHSIGLIALEGAFSPIDVSVYHDLEYRDVVSLAADCLLRENLITGPVHAAMTTPATLPPITGIDDPLHYHANVDAYLRSAPRIEALKRDFAEKTIALKEKSGTVLSPSLAAFNEGVDAYRNEKLSLAEYIELLAPPPGVGQAGVFAHTMKAEKSLNFPLVETDRQRLVERLVQCLTKDQKAQLVQQSAGYRLGQVRYADFYRYIQSLCRSAQIDFSQFPHMDAYIHYVLLSEQIDAEKLMDELAAREKARYAELAKTPEEIEYVAQSNALHLIQRLLTFSLTPQEWETYLSLKTERTPEDLSSFEAFYKEAHARDSAMTQNLLAEMDQKKTNTALLVTGGYHSTGMDEQLREAGVTVISFTPRVEKVDSKQGTNYLSIFSQEKSPLEKLFAGEKLYVTQHPASPATLHETMPVLLTGATAIMKGFAVTEEVIQKATPGKTPSLSVTLPNETTAHVTATDPARNASVTTEVTQTPEGRIVFKFQKVLPPALGIAMAFSLFPAIQSTWSILKPLLLSFAGWDPFSLITVTTAILFLSQVLNNTPLTPSPVKTEAQETKNKAPFSRYTALFTFQIDNRELHELLETYQKATRVAREVSILVRKTEDFVHAMVDVLRTIFTSLLEDTKKIPNPVDSLELIQRISEWESVPGVEKAAFDRFANIAEDPNCDPRIIQQIWGKFEKRAFVHFEKGEIEPWVEAHEFQTRLAKRTPLTIGNSNLTDWHILVFLQFFLETLSRDPRSAINLDNLLSEVSSSHIERYNKVALFFNLIYHGNEAMQQGKITTPQNTSSHQNHSIKKIAFARLGFKPIETSLYNDNGYFFDRLLYFLYSAYDKAKKSENISPDSPEDHIYVKNMLDLLENQISLLPVHPKGIITVPATWPTTFVRGYFLILGLGTLFFYVGASLMGFDATAFLGDHSTILLALSIALIPVSLPISSIFFAPWWEAQLRFTHPTLWASKHYGAVPGTMNHEHYLQLAKELNKATKENGQWAGIVAHGRKNANFWKAKFKDFFSLNLQTTFLPQIPNHSLIPSPLPPSTKESGFIVFDSSVQSTPLAPSKNWIEDSIQMEINKLRSMDPSDNLVRYKLTGEFQKAKDEFIRLRSSIEAVSWSLSLQLVSVSLPPETQKKFSMQLSISKTHFDKLFVLDPTNRDQMIEIYQKLSKINLEFESLLNQIEQYKKAPPRGPPPTPPVSGSPQNDDNQTFTAALLKLMPGQNEAANYSVGDVLVNILTNREIQIASQAPRQTQNPVDPVRVEAARSWLLEKVGINTHGTAIIPLTTELLGNPSLIEMANNALSIHPNILFITETGTEVPAAFQTWLESKSERVSLSRLPEESEKLFKNNTMELTVLEGVARNILEVQVYIPEGITPDFSGVQREQFKKEAVRPLSLLFSLQRLFELAQFLATQA